MTKRTAARSAGRRKATPARANRNGRTNPAPVPSVARPPDPIATGKATNDEPQALVVTYWFDPGGEGDPYEATMRLTGRRIGARSVTGRGDSFVQDERIERVVPGSGPISISAWVYGIEAGEWQVDADLIRPQIQGAANHRLRANAERLARATWSWRRWAVEDGPSLPLRSRWALIAPLARIPAVLPGSFTVLGALAIITALAIQSAILAGRGVAAPGSLAASLFALVVGLIGAKAWSRILHPGEKLIGPGWAVDGFLVTAPLAALAALLAFGIPIGPYLDASAPAIFAAVAIGRWGCFFTGCCAGRTTGSRFGIWSSDRRIGARRVPAQLMESGVGALLALASGVLVLTNAISISGAAFAVSMVTYLVARQFLLRLRDESRQYLWERRQGVSPARS